MVCYQLADAAATAALIDQVSPLLFRFFLFRSGSADEAADLLQEMWLRVHRARHTYRPGEPVLPWLYGIARHVQIDGFRRRRRIRFHEQALEGFSEIPARTKGEQEELPSFETIVAGLPESQREVVTMLKVTGMSLQEVALATASTVGSVKQKAHRAYEKLRQILSTPAEVGKRAQRGL